MKYLVTFLPDEDGGYVADCPVLHGCVSHGETLAEAEANIKDAIRLYLRTMRDEGLTSNIHVAEVEVALGDA